MNAFNSVISFTALKQAYQDRLLMYYQGGTWRATPEFVAWVFSQLQISNSKNIIAVDATGEPFEITNIDEFFQELNNHLRSMNVKYFSDYVALRQKINQEYRNVVIQEQQSNE